MFGATQTLQDDERDAMEAASCGYPERGIPAGTFHAWVVERHGVRVAGGGLQLRTLMPRPATSGWSRRG